MKYIALCLVASTFFLTMPSCKKEDKKVNPIIDSPVVVYADYTMLKPGNYWIYQEYHLDSVNGAAHPMGIFDSTFVEKDTTINGKIYHKYCDVVLLSGNPPQYSIFMLRDSLSYIVNSVGRILFSSTDFTSIFKVFTFGPNAATPDTLTVTEQMGFKDAAITVDAGTFITSTFRRIFHYPPGRRYGPTREYDYKYAKNVGVVLETSGFYEAIPDIYERRLVRYHVQ